MDIYPDPERRRGENPLAPSTLFRRTDGLFAEYRSMLDTRDCEPQVGGCTLVMMIDLATIRAALMPQVPEGDLGHLSLNSTRSHSPARLRFAPKWGSNCFLQFIHITKACRTGFTRK
jgi:hypothetical protein